jgi:hypothetical protein
MLKFIMMAAVILLSQAVAAKKVYFTNIRYIENKVDIEVCGNDICAVNRFSEDVCIEFVKNESHFGIVMKNTKHVVIKNDTDIHSYAIAVCPNKYMAVNSYDHSLWDGKLPYICESND